MSRHQFLLLLALTLGFAAGPTRYSLAQWRVDGAPVSTAPHSQGGTAMVADGAGGAIVAWEDSRSGMDWDIYAQRIDAAGVPQWTADGVALCTAPGYQEYTAIASDGAGGAIVTWEDRRSGTNRDIYAQRVDAAGAAQWAADGVALCTAANDQTFPIILSDEAGGAIVTWRDYRSGTSLDIYAQRVDAGGVPQWAADGEPLCTAANNQKNPSIASDGAGGAIVAWYDNRSPATGWDIYAQHMLASGAVDPAWTPNGVPVCVAPNGQATPTILSDGAGGAIVAWGDSRSGNSDIFVQHVMASGAVDPAWTANGVLLCTAPSDQQLPTLVSDGAGGAIVVWEDARGASWDIYARRVDGTGAPKWAASGVPLCTAAHDQYSPSVVSDGGGGAIVAWEDNRDLNQHIYAQHVLVSGTVDPVWTTNGVPLSTAGTFQAHPSIVSDGAGGAILAWEDYRSGTNYDVYAQRVYGAGAVAAVSPPSPPVGLQSLTLSPNPFRGQLTIRFAMPSQARVLAQILDLTGHRVRTLLLESEFSSGAQSLTWDGRDDAGARMPSGVYFVEVRLGKHAETRRAVLLH